MNRAERIRVGLCFGLLLSILVLLVGRLTYLQVLGKGSLAHADGRTVALDLGWAQRQQRRHEVLPAPRGTILDRQDKILAVDLPVMEVRAEVVLLEKERRDPDAWLTLEQSLVLELAHVLASDPADRDQPNLRNELRQKLRSRIRSRLEAMGANERSLKFLVAGDIDSVEVMEGLRTLEVRMDRVYLHFQRRYRRSYPHRDLTYGIVGSIAPELAKIEDRYQRLGVGGVEAVAALRPGTSGQRLHFVDSVAERFWSGEVTLAQAPKRVHITLDLDLQRVAMRELRRAAEIEVFEAYGSEPRWGAMVLVEIPTGDVLALASWQQGKSPAEASHAAYQLVYEPGSVVKALVFSIALEHGAVDWNRVFDCRPVLSGRGWKEPSYGRIVHDVTLSGDLTPPEILQRSSNIGAVQVGMGMSRELFQEYLDRYQLGRPTELGLPAEREGSYPRDVMSAPERRFWKYTAPSLTIGYELNVTALQLARAYVSLLSGRQRELRLYRSVELEDRTITVPQNDLQNERFLSVQTVETIVAALANVVSEDNGATGRHLYAYLRESGKGLYPDDRSMIGGKSGSSEGTVTRVEADGSRRRVEIRNATFVGFAPVDEPRYLAVAVLQKDDAAKFYGGTYTAPPVGRLLLRAMARKGGR